MRHYDDTFADTDAYDYSYIDMPMPTYILTINDDDADE